LFPDILNLWSFLSAWVEIPHSYNSAGKCWVSTLNRLWPLIYYFKFIICYIIYAI
jgi:hypothetical protein